MKKEVLICFLIICIVLISGCAQKECKTGEDCLSKACHNTECKNNNCVYTSISDCCGNDKCEQVESYESCSDDCPNCDDKNSCTIDEYDYHEQICVNTPITDVVCCGNNVCETGEDYTSCSKDCPDCGVDNVCKTNTRFDYHKQECVSDILIPCCGNDICDEGYETFSSCDTDCPNCDDNNDVTEDSYNYASQECENTKLLIEEDIGNYKYVESIYGGGQAEVILYSEDGEEIGKIKCASAVYQNSAGQKTGATVCPYDNKQDVINSLEGLTLRYSFVLGEYKGEKVYQMADEVIIWTNNAYLVTSGAEPGSGVLPVDVIIESYLKKYPNDLS